MSIFPGKKKEFFTRQEKERVIAAVRNAEQKTSGEVRVFIESRCRYIDAIDRAQEIFFNLEMDKTVERNAVLLYLAVNDRQVAVFGDKGIHEKVGQQYWNEEVNKMIASFRHNQITDGIVDCVNDIGDALHHYFPYNSSTDKNELPDEIVFGR